MEKGESLLPYGRSLGVFFEIKDFGVNSVDSATGAVAAGFFTFIDKGGKRRRLEILKKNKYMFAAMVAFN